MDSFKRIFHFYLQYVMEMNEVNIPQGSDLEKDPKDQTRAKRGTRGRNVNDTTLGSERNVSTTDEANIPQGSDRKDMSKKLFYFIDSYNSRYELARHKGLVIDDEYICAYSIYPIEYIAEQLQVPISKCPVTKQKSELNCNMLSLQSKTIYVYTPLDCKSCDHLSPDYNLSSSETETGGETTGVLKTDNLTIFAKGDSTLLKIFLSTVQSLLPSEITPETLIEMFLKFDSAIYDTEISKFAILSVGLCIETTSKKIVCRLGDISVYINGKKLTSSPITTKVLEGFDSEYIDVLGLDNKFMRVLGGFLPGLKLDQYNNFLGIDSLTAPIPDIYEIPKENMGIFISGESYLKF